MHILDQPPGLNISLGFSCNSAHIKISHISMLMIWNWVHKFFGKKNHKIKFNFQHEFMLKFIELFNKVKTI